MLHVHEVNARRRSGILSGYSAQYDHRYGVIVAPSTTNVTAWNDLSTNALNLTGNNSPQYDGAKVSINGAPNNRYLSRASNLLSFITANAWTYYSVVRVNAVSTNNASVYYNNDCLWTDTGNCYAGVFLRSAGFISSFHWDTTQKKAETTFTIGVFMVVTAWYDGTNLNIAVNNQAVPGTGAAGSIGNMNGTMLIGKNASIYSNVDYKAEAFYKTSHNLAQRTYNFNVLKGSHSVP